MRVSKLIEGPDGFSLELRDCMAMSVYGDPLRTRETGSACGAATRRLETSESTAASYREGVISWCTSCNCTRHIAEFSLRAGFGGVNDS